MSNKNYASVNPVSPTADKTWCLSAKMGPCKQAKILLPDGKKYDYLSRWPVAADDVVIIGNTYARNYEYTEESPYTGCFGQVESVADKATVSKDYAVELDFVFTTEISKAAIKQCAKYLEIDDYETTLRFKVETSPVRPINHFIRRILAASSILANKELADAAAIALAEKTIAEPPVLKENVLELNFCCWRTVIDLRQIYVPDVDCDAMLRAISEEAFIFVDDGSDTDEDNYPYEELLEKNDVKDFIAKYSYLGAISIMIRGGFTDMLKAFMDAKPPVGQYAEEILAQCAGNETAEAIIKAGNV